MIKGTIAQLETPWPIPGDMLPVYKTPELPKVIEIAPAPKPKHSIVTVIKSAERAPATKPFYGMVSPSRF